MIAMETRPAIIPNRWAGHRVDVCMVIRDREVRFVARDVYDALGLPLNEHLAAEAQHGRDLTAHADGTTWSREQVGIALGEAGVYGDPTVAAQALLAWLDELLYDVELRGIDRVIHSATPRPVDVTLLDPTPAPARDWYSVEEAARLLTTAGLTYTRPALFTVLEQRGWITRRDNTWWPVREFLLAGFLTVRDVRIPTADHLYPQVCLTPTGVTRLHTWLGGTGTLNLPGSAA